MSGGGKEGTAGGPVRRWRGRLCDYRCCLSKCFALHRNIFSWVCESACDIQGKWNEWQRKKEKRENGGTGEQQGMMALTCLGISCVPVPSKGRDKTEFFNHCILTSFASGSEKCYANLASVKTKKMVIYWVYCMFWNSIESFEHSGFTFTCRAGQI